MKHPAREKILVEVSEERDHQDRQWGGPSHDDQHQVAEFAEFIQHQLSRMTAQDCRARHVKIAALAVAAIESIDRKTQFNPGNPPGEGVYESRIPGAPGYLLRRWNGWAWLTNHATERDTSSGMLSSYQEYEWRVPGG